MTTTAIFGCTGAIGGSILATIIGQDAYTSIKTISRRLPIQESTKLDATLEADTSKWAPAIASFTPAPSVVYNAVGTTRAQAGGLDNQWKIDHDLCIELAKASKAAGVKTFVFISSAGTRGAMSRYVPYSKMKIGV
jgi:nucleoside-diphosphate-sugar epimerase